MIALAKAEIGLCAAAEQRKLIWLTASGLLGLIVGAISQAFLSYRSRAWFLPGPICIRGGLARHFASAWLFHRGIHLESTLASFARIIIQDQGLKRSPF